MEITKGSLGANEVEGKKQTVGWIKHEAVTKQTRGCGVSLMIDRREGDLNTQNNTRVNYLS